MNRYQREVAEMDRRHQLLVRALSFVGAAALIIVALWSAGLPPTAWWTGAHDWFAGMRGHSEERIATPQPSAPISAPAATVVAAPTAEVLPGSDSSISATPQALFLVATSPGRNKNEGTAQIGVNPDNPQTYVGGALLANGARLAEIHRDYVVLARDGRSAQLPLYRRNTPAASVSGELLAVGGDQQVKVVAAVTREVLTDYLRPTPMYDGEVLRGYEVYPGMRADVFARLGLRAGDVITAINGLPLAEPHQAMELFRELTHGSAMTATIRRKGAVHRISIDGSLIVSDLNAAQSSATQPQSPLAAPTT
ncbi:MAG: hypothetical protein EHM84_02050 [Lysobacterales bacterium]|nr:MAG: hypothetical protein EHM84_02050 [Xanthomonadales bacterium]